MTCSCEKNQCAGGLPNEVIEVIKECGPVLFHRVLRPASLGDDTVTPPDQLDYKNVLLVYEANSHVYLYSSDGVPTFISMGEVDTDELLEKINLLSAALAQEVADREVAVSQLQNELEDVEANQSDLAQSVEALETAQVQKDTSISADESTVTITKTVGELTKAGAETGIPLPVASENSAGVLNASTYKAIQENAENIDSVLGGAVVIEDLPAEPTDAQLTAAWEQATGKTELINRASIYDETNKKVWYYYENASAWKAIDATPSFSVSVATNEAAGIVKGSTENGQVAVEADGTMSLNGYDALTSDVANLQSEVDGIVVPSLENSLTGYNFLNNKIGPSLTSRRGGNYFQINYGSFGANQTWNGRQLSLELATTTAVGMMSAADKTKLDNLLDIQSLGEGLELSEGGVLSATGGGSDVNLLTTYTAEPGETDVYDASYVNKRLNGIGLAIGENAKAYTGSQHRGVALGASAIAGVYGVAIGGDAVARNYANYGAQVAIGKAAQAHQEYGSAGMALGAYSSIAETPSIKTNYSVALGAYSTSKRPYEVSVGSGAAGQIPNTRFLANVTAGELPTDAVNLQQMQDYVAEAGVGGNTPTVLYTGTTQTNSIELSESARNFQYIVIIGATMGTTHIEQVMTTYYPSAGDDIQLTSLDPQYSATPGVSTMTGEKDTWQLSTDGTELDLVQSVYAQWGETSDQFALTLNTTSGILIRQILGYGRLSS